MAHKGSPQDWSGPSLAAEFIRWGMPNVQQAFVRACVFASHPHADAREILAAWQDAGCDIGDPLVAGDVAAARQQAPPRLHLTRLAFWECFTDFTQLVDDVVDASATASGPAVGQRFLMLSLEQWPVFSRGIPDPAAEAAAKAKAKAETEAARPPLPKGPRYMRATLASSRPTTPQRPPTRSTTPQRPPTRSTTPQRPPTRSTTPVSTPHRPSPSRSGTPTRPASKMSRSSSTGSEDHEEGPIHELPPPPPLPPLGPPPDTIDVCDVVVALALLCDAPLDDRLSFLFQLFHAEDEEEADAGSLAALLRGIARGLCTVGVLAPSMPPPEAFERQVEDLISVASQLSKLAHHVADTTPLSSAASSRRSSVASVEGAPVPRMPSTTSSTPRHISLATFIVWARSSEVPYTVLRQLDDHRNFLRHASVTGAETAKAPTSRRASIPVDAASTTRSSSSRTLTSTTPAPTSMAQRRRRLRMSALNSVATDEELAVLSSQLPFSVYELKRLRAQFSHVANKHGQSLELEAFKTLLLRTMGSLGNDRTLTRLFDVFDLDYSGTIEFSEFVTGMATVIKGSRADKAAVMFSLWDRDGSNVLEVSELVQFVRDTGDMGPLEMARFADELNALLDINGDGSCSREEFTTVLLREPSLFDCFSRAICPALATGLPPIKWMSLAPRSDDAPLDPSSPDGDAPDMDFSTLAKVWAKYARDEDMDVDVSGGVGWDTSDNVEVGAVEHPDVTPAGGAPSTPHTPYKRSMDLPAFRRFMVNEFGCTPAVMPLVHRIFNHFDKDSNGSVSLLELFDGMSHVLTQDTAQLADFYFDLYDTKGAGVVVKADIISMLFSTRRPSAVGENFRLATQGMNVSVTELLAELDTDGDGFVTREEWHNGCHKDPRLLRLLGVMFGGKRVSYEAPPPPSDVTRLRPMDNLDEQVVELVEQGRNMQERLKTKTLQVQQQTADPRARTEAMLMFGGAAPVADATPPAAVKAAMTSPPGVHAVFRSPVASPEQRRAVAATFAGCMSNMGRAIRTLRNVERTAKVVADARGGALAEHSFFARQYTVAKNNEAMRGASQTPRPPKSKRLAGTPRRHCHIRSPVHAMATPRRGPLPASLPHRHALRHINSFHTRVPPAADTREAWWTPEDALGSETPSARRTLQPGFAVYKPRVDTGVPSPPAAVKRRTLTPSPVVPPMQKAGWATPPPGATPRAAAWQTQSPMSTMRPTTRAGASIMSPASRLPSVDTIPDSLLVDGSPPLPVKVVIPPLRL